MRVTELILDGFKSYPVRTSIAGWDSSFNAITGLNGSGKSNILDSICFVLGITNMTTVRAQNLLDLIYKRGQAGVTRASVTIVFDNSDKSSAPVGFENMAEISVTRQISVNGQSKYLVCGHRSTQQQVQSLFQSVQLNINNPNFLIMQGKITKVLNMRPQEILSMIEEAAGTSMFEEKKDKAIKTMAKKEKKLEEILSLLNEEITPKLDRLREEKRVFLEFQKTSSELERLSKLVIAYEWLQDHAKVEKAREAVAKGEERRKEAIAARTRMEGEISKMEKEMHRIEKQRDAELAKGGKVQALEKQLSAIDMEITKLKTQAEGKAKEIKEEEAKIKDLERNAKELVEQRAAREKSATKTSETFAAKQAAFDAAVASLASSEDLLQTIEYGKGLSKDAKSSGYEGQLAAAKELAGSLATEGQLAKHKIESLQKEIKEKEPKAKKAAQESKGLLQNLEQSRKEKDDLEKRLKASGYDEAQEAELTTRREQEIGAFEQVKRRRDAKRNEVSRTDFRADDPYPNFDRSSVYGTIASLIELDDANSVAATALEIAAGGRLYNVAVRDDATVSAFIKAKTIKTKTILLPVSNLQTVVADRKRVAAAEKHGAQLALNLIRYDHKVSKALEYVFGNVLIAPNKHIAKRCTDDPAVRMKCVTYDGDVYDTSAGMSGGSTPNDKVLVKVQELRKLEQELAKRRASLEEIDRQLVQSKGAVDLKRALDTKAHALSLLEKSMANSNATRIIAEVDQLRQTVAELEGKGEELRTKIKDAQSEVKRIEREMTELQKDKGGKVKQIKADIVKKKAEVAKLEEAVASLRNDAMTDSIELEQVKKDISASGTDLAEARTYLTTLREALSTAQSQVAESTKEYRSIEAKIAEETKMITAFNDELDTLKDAINGKKKDIVDNDLKVTQVEKDVERAKKDAKDASTKVAKREAEFEWIQDECQTFGKENSPYNFTGLDMGNAREKCRQLEENHRKMKRKVNPKVLTMIDSVEKKERDLLAMYRQVVKDKTKIEETVAKLDEHKKETLEKTWGIVNTEFGNIFAELLPGNFCKLQPLEGKEITFGLEVKVRLGQVWKASLTELSGGQRSLIALSLIMSLLRFKPAPMYILDEIDAALDLSHTENIGRLFRTRFKGSQFIVVSLKDGLFANANVLFRTRFRDGTSIVERTAQRSTSALYDKENVGGPRAGGHGRKRPGFIAIIQPFNEYGYASVPIFHWRFNLQLPLAWKLKNDLYRKFNSNVLVVPSLFPPVVTVLVADARAINQVNGDHQHFIKDKISNGTVASLFGPSILTLEGAEWRRHRRVVVAGFSASNTAAVWDSTIDIVNKWMNDLQQQAGLGQEVLVRTTERVWAKLALLIIGRAGFGVEFGWPFSKNVDESPSQTTFFDASFSILRDWVPLVYVPSICFRPFPFTPRLKRIGAGHKVFERELKEVVANKVRDVRSQKKNGNDDGQDILSLLCRANVSEDAKNTLSEQELFSNAFVFLIAGHETTAGTVTALFAFLALYPRCQQRLFEEASTLIGDGTVTSYPATYQALPYTLAVVQETLRIAGPAQNLLRRSLDLTTLPSKSVNADGSSGESRNVTIPAGTYIREHVLGVHYSNDWENATEFRPERFLELEKGGDQLKSFLPFNSGSRGCIGRQFSLVESVALVASIVSKYRVDIPPHEREKWALKDNESEDERRDRVLQPLNAFVLGPQEIDLLFVPRE
ncbi:condensin subunit SMC2 [Sporobolomyces koalae]|uniref:condensin subunit SMC2 n=1 Tax=Sporobolomyces koalae TaxID=500713 RepID=UPI00317D2FC0